MNDIKIYEQLLDGEKGTLTILFGGLGENNPKAYMDRVVSDYVANEMYNEFIEVFLDNPYVRVIITGINELELEDYNAEYHVLEGIKNRLSGKLK